MTNKNKKKKGRRNSENETPNLEGKCSHVKDCVKSSNLTKVIPHADLSKCSECSKVVPENNKTSCDKKGNEGSNDVTQTEEKTDICVCLRCGNVACSRQSTHQHAVQHYDSKSSHPLAVNLSTWMVWCYKCDDEVDVETNPALGQCLGILKKALGSHAAKQGQEKHEKLQKKPSSNIYSCAGNMNKVKGLANLGNTCFFNSVMQNLCQTQLLRVTMNHLMLSNFECSISPSGDNKNLASLSVTITDKPGPLTSALAKFLQDMTSGGKKHVIDPGYLFTEICKKAPRFKGFRQQDSQELLRYLLDSVRTEEIKNVKRAILHSFGVKSAGTKEGLSADKVDDDVHEKIKAYGRNARAPVIDTLFGGQLVSSVECRTCHKVSTIMESFFDLSLSLTTINSTVSKQGNTIPATKKKQTTVPVNSKKNGTKNANKDTEVIPKPAQAPSKHQLKKKAKETKKGKREKRKRLNSGSNVGRKQSEADDDEEIEDDENSETPSNDVTQASVDEVHETSSEEDIINVQENKFMNLAQVDNRVKSEGDVIKTEGDVIKTRQRDDISASDLDEIRTSSDGPEQNLDGEFNGDVTETHKCDVMSTSKNDVTITSQDNVTITSQDDVTVTSAGDDVKMTTCDTDDLSTACVRNGNSDESISECDNFVNEKPPEYSSQECFVKSGSSLEMSESSKSETCNDEDLGTLDANEITSDDKVRDRNDNRISCVNGIDGQDFQKESLLHPNGEHLLNSIEKERKEYHTSVRPQIPSNDSHKDVTSVETNHISEMTEHESDNFFQNGATCFPPNCEENNSLEREKINEYINQIVNDALELSIRSLLSSEDSLQEEKSSCAQNTSASFPLRENDNVIGRTNEIVHDPIQDTLDNITSSLLSEKDKSISSECGNMNKQSSSIEDTTASFPLKKNDGEHVYKSVEDVPKHSLHNISSSLLIEKDGGISSECEKMNKEFSSVQNITASFPLNKNDSEHVRESESMKDVPKQSLHNISSTSLSSENNEKVPSKSQKVNDKCVQNTKESYTLKKNDSEKILEFANQIVNDVLKDALHEITISLLAEEAQTSPQSDPRVEVDLSYESNKLVENHGSSVMDDNEKVLLYANKLVEDAIRDFLYDISISLLSEELLSSTSDNSKVQTDLSCELNKIEDNILSSCVQDNADSLSSTKHTDAANALNSQNGTEMNNFDKTIENNSSSSENDNFSKSKDFSKKQTQTSQNGIEMEHFNKTNENNSSLSKNEGFSESNDISKEGTSECEKIENGVSVDSKNIESVQPDNEISASGSENSIVEAENGSSGSEILCGNHSLGSMESIKSNVMTVESCLKKFCSPEILDGDNKFICEECNRTDEDEVLEENDEVETDKVEIDNVETEENEKETPGKKKAKRKPVYTEAVKQLLINQAPPILTLHLKRFHQVGYSLKKLAKHVDFPLVLDLAPFCHKSGKLATDSKGKVMYALCGIVEHSGGLHSGHYTAYCRVPTVPSSLFETKFKNLTQMLEVMEHMWTGGGNRESYVHEGPSSSRWFHISDSHVSEVGLERVLKAQAYLLLYERMVLSHGGERSDPS